MAIILFLLLNCINTATHEYPLLKVNDVRMLDTVGIGPPKQKAVWKMKPSIRVCATAEVPLYRVREAMLYWQTLGYHFDGMRKDLLSTCMNARYGEIIITLPESGFKNIHMAATKLYTSNSTGEIVKAKIYMLPKHARKERVIEHEIGHALGWAHYSQRRHIMHPNWQDGGYDSKGLGK